MDPKPYVPMAVSTAGLGSPETARKPWQRLLPGESPPARWSRLAHTCWACGRFEVSMDELDRHEETCRGTGS